MNDDIRFILEQALTTPSGDNNQPWRWVVRGETLELWSQLADSPLDTLFSDSKKNGRSAYLALGMAVENASIAATVRGYRATSTYFPNPSEPTLVAVLKLSKDANVQPDPLAKVISKRITNRKPYRRALLRSDERTKLLAIANADSTLGELKLLDDRSRVNELAKVVSVYDEAMFSNKSLHDYVFPHINWTKREDTRRRVGFYFPTLAAPPLTWGFMQLLRHWWIMRVGTVFGLHRVIALEQRFIYRQASAYGLVLAHGDSSADWMRAGRLAERLWLAATEADLSLHPLNGIIYLAIGSETEEGQHAFTRKERTRFKEGQENIARIFDIEGKTLAFMFRIGHGNPPTARTSRLPFEQMVEVISETPPSAYA